MQTNLIDQINTFDGETYDPIHDRERLGKQMKAVIELMEDGKMRTLEGISEHCGIPQQSASARLRDLRKERYGNQIILRSRLRGGSYAYCWVRAR